MVAEWFRAPAITSCEEGDVGLSKIPFPDEIFLNNSIVYLNRKSIVKVY